jgi:uncharacterized membrane protein YdbT with pleckstrin-like domain
MGAPNEPTDHPKTGPAGSSDAAAHPPGMAAGSPSRAGTPSAWIAAQPDEPERDLWTGRPAWGHFAGRLAVGIVLTVVVISLIALITGGGVPFWGYLLILLGSGVIFAGSVAWKIHGIQYRLTSQRLIFTRGILGQTIDQSELLRIDDVRVRKPLLDRFFGLGNVELASTDVSDEVVVLEGIREPEQVAEMIRTHVRKLRRSTLTAVERL